MRVCCGFLLRFGNVLLGAASGAAAIVAETPHADYIDDPVKVLFSAVWKMNRYSGAAESLMDAFDSTFERGALAIKFIHHKRGGEVEFLSERPDFFGRHFDTGDAIKNNDCRIGGDERRPSLIQEDVVTGSVNEIDFGLLPCQ